MKERIDKVLGKARHWLPAQGPIGVFIHHNTLHALEDKPFEEAVELAAHVRGGEPYLAHERYLELIAQGRISEEKIRERLPDTQPQWYRTLLDIDSSEWTDTVVGWLRGEMGWAPDENLWKAVVRPGSARPPTYPHVKSPPADEELIAFLSAYTDRGVSMWPLPDRDRGILGAFQRLHGLSPLDAYGTITKSLVALGVTDGEVEEFLFRELMALPGWAGIVGYLEARPAEANQLGYALADYLAIRLWLREKHAKSEREPSPLLTRGELGAQLERYLFCDRLGVKPTDVDWEEVEAFDGVARRRMLQQAYEQTLYSGLLDSLAHHRKTPAPKPANPSYQAVFCIDDREESLRRHLEELGGNQIETFAIAGFFGVDMLYHGMGNPQPEAHCPVVVTPKHRIIEEPAPKYANASARWHKNRGTIQATARGLHDTSRGMLTGMIVCAVGGLVSAVPLITRVLFPQQASWFRRKATNWLHPTVETKLRLQRTKLETEPDGIYNGYSLEEMATRVANVLKAINLTSGFARLVFFVGHGSASLNNPHRSAYDCGACGGKSGAPNGRAFAQMANHPEVRAKLKANGIMIPDTTHFVGGFHNTCSDAIPFSDLADIPASHRADFEKACYLFDDARTHDAHERCRRFETARHLNAADALRHVENRGQSLSQARPEYGHATNAYVIVGRRELTRGLFLDRRAFMSSYDAKTDPNGTILAGILGAVIPVCAGIGLEYYFSCVDNEVYGAGTKLPHNITGLIGVMAGSRSDLRTGLPRQMIEIHEPARLIFVIEAPVLFMEQIMAAREDIRKLIENAWVTIVMMDRDTGALTRYQNGAFKPYQPQEVSLAQVSSSAEHYFGKIEHLPAAQIHAKGTANG